MPNTASLPRLRLAPRRPFARRSREALAFGGASVLALAHAFDDAFLLPGSGVPITRHALAAAIALVATVAAVATFDRLRPGLRSVIAFSFGLLATVNGGRHLVHATQEGATANDVTGVLALAAGVALLGLAAWIPFRHRGAGAATPRRRWAIRALSVPVGLVAAWAVFMPVGTAVVDIHSLSRPVGSPPDASYETVRFSTSDGLRLEGWHRKSENGATVLMLAGGGSNRRSTLRHAEMLVSHGYGVLLYDPRGSGRSEGTINSYGWGWDKDADAALEHLHRVTDDRIGALGLSTGADMAIDAAGRRDDLEAVVADGSARIGYEDAEAYSDSVPLRLQEWMLFKTIEVIQGTPGPKVALADRIAATSAPHLLVSAGTPEKGWGELYDRAGGDRSTLWHLPKATHTAALEQYPDEYERRVVSFLEENLLGGPNR